MAAEPSFAALTWRLIAARRRLIGFIAGMWLLVLALTFLSPSRALLWSLVYGPLIYLRSFSIILLGAVAWRERESAFLALMLTPGKALAVEISVSLCGYFVGAAFLLGLVFLGRATALPRVVMPEVWPVAEIGIASLTFIARKAAPWVSLLVTLIVDLGLFLLVRIY